MPEPERGCRPAIYDLGQDANVVALSVTAGEDKPLKYPTMFHKADMVLLTKIDLLPSVTLSLADVEHHLSSVMPRPAAVRDCATTGRGIDAWMAWLKALGVSKPAQPANDAV